MFVINSMHKVNPLEKTYAKAIVLQRKHLEWLEKHPSFNLNRFVRYYLDENIKKYQKLEDEKIN